jgi:hypothetical protein
VIEQERACPRIFCDVCGERIADANDGNALSDVAGDVICPQGLQRTQATRDAAPPRPS